MSSSLSSVLVILALFLISIPFSYTSVLAQSVDPMSNSLGVPDTGEIVAVKFMGNKSISSEELQSVITTRAASFIELLEYQLSFHNLGSNTQFTDESTRDHDTSALVVYYRAQGFMNAHATCVVRTDSLELARAMRILHQNLFQSRALRKPVPTLKDTIIFQITEGAPAVITGVTYDGLENLPDALQPELQEHSLLKRNMQYSAKLVVAERDRLSKILGENGYPFFRLASDVIVAPANPENTKVHIEFFFVTGHRYRVGKVSIVYDSTSVEKSRVNAATVLSEVDIDSGSWYNSSTMTISELNLNKLGPFENARVVLDTSELWKVPAEQREGTVLPVRVELRMRRVSDVSVGVFGGSGILGASFGATAGYTNRNFFGGAQFLDLNITYQFLPTSQVYYTGSVNLTFPFRTIPFLTSIFPVITNAPLTIGSTVSRAEQVNRYDERLINGHISSNIVIGDPANRTSISPELTGELVYRQYLDSALRAYYELNQPNGEKSQINSIASLSGQWDRTNDFANPTKGFYTGGAVELGRPVLQFLVPTFGSAAYFKWLVHLKDFEPLNSEGTLVIGGRVRVADEILANPGPPIDQLHDIPIERRLFVGGGSSVRGWPSQALLVVPTYDSLRQTTEGGYRSFELNFELRWMPFSHPSDMMSSQKLLSPLQVVLFYDAGQVWDYGVNPSMGQLAFAVGTGVRYLTLIGPIRFDFGIKLYDPNPSPPSAFAPALPSTQGEWIFKRRFNSNVYSFSFNLGQAF
jgi:translocation and assembly module TamA